MAVSDDYFLTWLERSPCRFARVFAAKASIVPLELLEPFSATDVAAIDLTLDRAAQANKFGLILWPLLRSPAEIVSVLEILGAAARWRVSRVAWNNHEQADAVQVGVTWRTPGGDQSSVMGFGPLGTMPVTRRGPYWAIGVWPGKHENAKHRSPDGVVGFIDAPLPPTSTARPEYTYDTLFKQTGEAVTRVFSAPPKEDKKRLREVAFVLPNSVVGDRFGATTGAVEAV